MLKKILSNLVYFAVMLCLSFAIYHYFLRPNKELAHSTIENKTLSSRVDSIDFTYSPDIQNATRFSINLILKEGVGKEEVKVNTTSEITFRNR